MRKLLCLVLALCCLTACALAQDSVALGSAAAMAVPEDWLVLDASECPAGSLAAFSFGGATVAIYDYSSMGASPEAIIAALQNDSDYINIKASLLATGSPCVTFELGSTAESGLIVMNEQSGCAICLRYAPISDSELGLIVRSVAEGITFTVG